MSSLLSSHPTLHRGDPRKWCLQKCHHHVRRFAVPIYTPLFSEQKSHFAVMITKKAFDRFSTGFQNLNEITTECKDSPLSAWQREAQQRVKVNPDSLFNPQGRKHGQILTSIAFSGVNSKGTAQLSFTTSCIYRGITLSNHRSTLLHYFMHLPRNYTVKSRPTCLTNNIVKAALCEKKFCRT